MECKFHSKFHCGVVFKFSLQQKGNSIKVGDFLGGGGEGENNSGELFC